MPSVVVTGEAGAQEGRPGLCPPHASCPVGPHPNAHRSLRFGDGTSVGPGCPVAKWASAPSSSDGGRGHLGTRGDSSPALGVKPVVNLGALGWGEVGILGCGGRRGRSLPAGSDHGVQSRFGSPSPSLLRLPGRIGRRWGQGPRGAVLGQARLSPGPCAEPASPPHPTLSNVVVTCQGTCVRAEAWAGANSAPTPTQAKWTPPTRALGMCCFLTEKHFEPSTESQIWGPGSQDA